MRNDEGRGYKGESREKKEKSKINCHYQHPVLLIKKVLVTVQLHELVGNAAKKKIYSAKKNKKQKQKQSINKEGR